MKQQWQKFYLAIPSWVLVLILVLFEFKEVFQSKNLEFVTVLLVFVGTKKILDKDLREIPIPQQSKFWRWTFKVVFALAWTLIPLFVFHGRIIQFLETT